MDTDKAIEILRFENDIQDCNQESKLRSSSELQEETEQRKNLPSPNTQISQIPFNLHTPSLQIPPIDLALSENDESSLESESFRPHHMRLRLERIVNEDEENVENSFLPVAIPMENTDLSTSVDDDGSGSVIDGIVVNDDDIRMKKRASEILLLIIISVFLVLVGIFVSRRFKSEEGTLFPSLVPSVSLAPTTVLDYDSYVKALAIEVSGREKVNDPSTIQYFAYKRIAGFLPIMLDKKLFELDDIRRIKQRYVILVFTMFGSPTVDFNQYEASLDECLLPVYSCNENKLVTGIYIINRRSTNGSGILATEIGAFQELRHLVLPGNGVMGNIPSELGKLEHLTILDLKNNAFSGEIPEDISQLQRLEYLDVRNNLLQRNIPSNLGNLKELQVMDLSENLLTGSIPNEINSLHNLKRLSLHNSSLTGDIEVFCEEKGNLTTQDEIEFLTNMPSVSYKFEQDFIIDCKSKADGINCSCCTCV